VAEHNELGKVGEKKAVLFLQNLGYEILETNWIFQKAEIDIIAFKNNILAVVEVKTRTSIDFGDPQDFVSPTKIKHLVKAADNYILEKKLEYDIRFDIIAIHKDGKNFNISHIEDAFYYF
jgi:putative endonuclease